MEENKELNKIVAEENTRKAMEKLKREKLEVSINPKKYLLDFTKEEIDKIEATDKSKFTEADLSAFEEVKKVHTENLEKYKEAKLEGILVPLKYKDLQTIKDGILEAVKYAKEFNWDDDIRLRAMIREEHTLTVYLSLKKKEDVTQRYYGSLEEIAKEPDAVVDEIYLLYFNNFILSDTERKNF